MLHRVSLAILLIVSSTLSLAQTPPPYKDKTTAFALAQAASTAYQQKKYAESAALYLYAIERGQTDATTLYNGACSAALAGDTDNAFRLLKRSVDAGYRNVDHLKSDTDFGSLHSEKRWAETVKHAERKLAAYKKEKSNPDRAKIVTSDIQLFWNAYQEAKAAPREQWNAIFQREYLDKGSIGLTDFMAVRRADTKRLTDYVAKAPRFYDAVHPITLDIKKLEADMRKSYQRMKEIYPEALFPDVYFLVGGFFGGGTVSNNSLLLSAEMYGLAPGTPKDELGEWEKTVLADAKELPTIVAHELVHFQQNYPGSDRSLLRSCIQEGSASFIGTLASEGWMSKREAAQHAYGNAHEKELWEEFSKELTITDTKGWLYSGSGKGVRPDDLGYWMGYKICEAYYNRMTDKRQAVRDILNIKDFPAFLKASGYAEKFR